MTALLAMHILAQAATYNGFVRTDFKVDGLEALVVAPSKVAPGRPWIWRMEFFDHRPMLDIELLKQGYHLAYINVGNTYGSPAAVWHLSHLYSELTGPTWNLNKRVILEGFSRGGLYAYNWAIRNPSKVMAIYGDAPVTDFTTWPKTKSPDDWRGVIKEYGFPSEDAAVNYQFRPLNCLDVLAKAKVPIIHVVGDADEVVDVTLNTGVIEKQYRKLHGTIEVINKPGGLHHPHSLDDPTPLVQFLLKHKDDTARSLPATMIAAPNLETRSGSAGWGTTSWFQQHLDGTAGAKQEARVALMGDSITQGFGGLGRHVGEPGGSARLTLDPSHEIANLGISGDRVQNVLWRVQNGAFDNTRVKVVCLMIGINNFGDDSPADVASGIINVTQQIKRRNSGITVLVQPLTPAGKAADAPIRAWSNEVNVMLRQAGGRGTIQLAFPDHNAMLNSDGSQKAEMFSSDGLHLSPKGYENWSARISVAIQKRLGK